MAFKQPRVPEYREADGVRAYMRVLIAFLKDFSYEAWTAYRQLKKENEEIKQRLETLERK